MFTQRSSKQFSAKNATKENLLADKFRQSPKYPQAGEIFLEHGDKLDLKWVVLFPHHKNEQLLLTVPGDDNPMAGTTDITISEDALSGPLTLRCGHSLWIHKTDFNMETYVGVLENRQWQRALNKMEQIFEGNLQGTASEVENEADPEYKKWMTQLSQEHETMRQALHEKPVKVLETAPSLLERFVSSLKKAVEKFKKEADKIQEGIEQTLADISIIPISPLEQPMGTHPAPELDATHYQLGQLQLAIKADDDEHMIELQIKWLGEDPINIILLDEEQEPVQKRMGIGYAEYAAPFLFDPSLSHTIVTQDATGKEHLRLTLEDIKRL
jgi:hypothetical protein